jgi:hypothetical protein
VKDSSGQQLAYVYFEDEPDHRSAARPLQLASQIQPRPGPQRQRDQNA